MKETSTAAVDPWHLEDEVTEQDFPNCSYVINTTCQYPMLIMYIKSIKNWENIKHKSMKIKIQGYLTTLYILL